MKSNLAKSHDAMLAFLEKLIRDSDSYYGGHRTPKAQRNYDKARKLIAKAHEVRGVPVSRNDGALK